MQSDTFTYDSQIFFSNFRHDCYQSHIVKTLQTEVKFKLDFRIVALY